MITVRDKKNQSHKVPCGKCAFCLTNRRAQWMFRIHHEMRVQEHPGWFLTLTYDEKHVPRGTAGLTLRFYDVQLFIKRIRKAKYYVKYICVGEYGSETCRPHYHLLIWTDCPALVLQKEWKSSKDNSLFGTIHFGRLNMQSAMYTLKYIIQPKQKREDEKEPTRAQFSRGIGLGYLTTQVYDYHTMDYDNPEMFSYIDGRKVALPRYYKTKIFTKYQMREQCHEVKLKTAKEKRKVEKRLIANGMPRPKSYLKGLRNDQAARIISTTKFNQKL